MNQTPPPLAKDEATMRLSHPLRCATAWEEDLPPWEQVLGPYTWSALRTAFAVPGSFTPDVVTALIQDPKNRLLSQFIHHVAADSSSTELGGAYGIALFWRNVLYPQPYFLVEDSLLEMLEHTDISDDLPMSSLAPPFARCFIEFGKLRQCEERVPNLTSGLHVLECAYIEEGVSAQQGEGVFITFVGSPLGKEHVLDDATDSVFLPRSSPDEPILQVLEKARATSQKLSLESNLRTPPAEYGEYSFSCLKLLVKVLLYIGLPEARKTLHAAYSEQKKAIAAKKNPAKRAKASKQLNRLADYVLVSAPASSTGTNASAGHPGVKSHWRRGHYRMQPYGVQLSLRKVIFLQPTLVGALTQGSANAGPAYRVR